MKLSPGFYDALDFEDYAKIEAYNGSSIVHMERSPLHYRYQKDHPATSSPAMVLGTMTHRMILEPNRIGDFTVWGELPEQKVRLGKVWDAFKSQANGKLIVTRGERDAMVGISVAVHRNRNAHHFLKGGRSEVSMVWREPVTGVMLKGRLDYLIDSGAPIITDLKTTRDSRPMQFGNQSFRLGYHFKLALYHDGYYHLTGKLPQVKLVAVESKPPYESAVYSVPDHVLQQGHEDYSRLLQRILDCEEAGVWPGANESESDLSLPSYAYGEMSDDLSELELQS